MSTSANWGDLGKRMSLISGKLHNDGVQRTNAEHDAEVVRLLVTQSSELTTTHDYDHMLAATTFNLRDRMERATRVAEEARAALAQCEREGRQQMADLLRDRCNERTVPSKMRRDGVLLAAEWLTMA